MIDRTDSRLWYVVQTKPASEGRVRAHLTNQGIEVFLPLLKTSDYCWGKMVPRIRPFFPNYLFARIDLERSYYRVKWTRGVSKILGTGDRPVPISEKVIQSIQGKTGRDNLVDLEEEWKKGDIVQIASGPFKELRGIFQKKMSDQERVRILLSLLGVDVPVEISRWQIRKVA
ncbi:MAG: transcription termination/antitermination protein NusG [Thermodesulfobacteriota bacterium]